MADTITVKLAYGEQFEDSLVEDMVEELSVAEEKWNVAPSTEERRDIVRHSMNQLKRRIATVCGESWDQYGAINMTLKGYSYPYKIDLSKALPKGLEDAYVVRKRDGFAVDSEVGEDSFSIHELQDKIEGLIRAAARTAVFYGVGSYAQ